MPTIDGTAASSGNSTATPTVALTTSLTGDVIVLVVSTAEFFGVDAPTVTGVSDTAGLGWTELFHTASINDGNNTARQSVFYAYAAGALTTDTITATLSSGGGFDSYAIVAFGVNGVLNASSAPWDPNPSVPKTATNNLTADPPSATGVTTTTDGDLLISIYSTRDGGPFLTWYPTGFNLLNQVRDTSQGAQVTVAWMALSGLVSGATYTPQDGEAASNPQIFTIAALGGNASHVTTTPFNYFECTF